MLIILQAISHFQEAILPLVIRKLYSTGIQLISKNYPKLARILTDDEDKGSSKENNNSSLVSSDSIWNPASLGLQVLDNGDPRIEKSKIEGELDPYEVFIQ